jgi:hypothetical protein
MKLAWLLQGKKIWGRKIRTAEPIFCLQRPCDLRDHHMQLAFDVRFEVGSYFSALDFFAMYAWQSVCALAQCNPLNLLLQ